MSFNNSRLVTTAIQQRDFHGVKNIEKVLTQLFSDVSTQKARAVARFISQPREATRRIWNQSQFD